MKAPHPSLLLLRATVLGWSWTAGCGHVASRAQETPLPALRANPVASEARLAEQLGVQNLGDELREAEGIATVSLDAAEPAVGVAVATAEVSEVKSLPAGRRWRISPHLDVGVTYDDNIFIQPRDEVADAIFAAAIGVTAGFWEDEAQLEQFLAREQSASFMDKRGDNYLLLDYTGILLGFARTDSQNAYDQDASFDTQWRGDRLTLGASARFASRSDANVEVGGRVRRTRFDSSLVARYQVNEKVAFEAGLFGEVNDPEDFDRTVELRNEDYLVYRVLPELGLGLGLAAGHVQVESGADQTFERALGRVDYALTQRLTLDLRGGVEFRQTDGPRGDQVNPVFDLQVRYEPVPAWRVGLDAYRQVVPSVLTTDQDYTTTGFSVVLSPELREGMRFSLAGGYQVSDYTELAGAEGRTDHYFFVRSRLLYNFARWGSASLSYERRENDSTRPTTGFKNNQFSLQTSFRY